MSKVALELSAAAKKNRGLTLEPTDLQTLIEATVDRVSCPIYSSEEESAKLLLDKAKYALKAKRTLELTSGDVKILFLLSTHILEQRFKNFGISIDVDRIPALHNHDSRGPIPGILHLNLEYRNFLENMSGKLKQCGPQSTGVCLTASEAFFLRSSLFLTYEERGVMPTNPDHALVTARNKCARVGFGDTTSRIHLDPEEVSCIIIGIDQWRKNESTREQNPTTSSQDREPAASSKSNPLIRNEKKTPLSSSESREQAVSSKSNSLTRDEKKTPLSSSEGREQAASSKPDPQTKQQKGIKPLKTNDKNREAKLPNSMSTTEVMRADSIMKDLVATYMPSVVADVLGTNQNLVTRWVDRIDDALKEMKAVVLESENKYEADRLKSEDEIVRLKAELLEQAEKFQAEAQASTKAFDEKISNNEKKYKEQLRIEIDHHAGLRRAMDNKIADLEVEVRTTKKETKELKSKAKTDASKVEAQHKVAMQKHEDEISTLEGKLETETARANVLNLDCEAILADRDGLKDDVSMLKEREAKYAALDSEVAALR